MSICRKIKNQSNCPDKIVNWFIWVCHRRFPAAKSDYSTVGRLLATYLLLPEKKSDSCLLYFSDYYQIDFNSHIVTSYVNLS